MRDKSSPRDPDRREAESERLRIFMVVPGTFRERTQNVARVVDGQAESLRASGWSVTVGIVDDRTSASGILRNVRRLSGEVAEANPTLLHAQYGTVTAAIANRVRGNRPLVVSFVGEDLLGSHETGLRWRLRTLVSRQLSLLAARRASAITVVSRNLERALPASLRDKCVVLPYGVDMDFFAPMDRAEARSKLGWGNEQIVLFASNRGSRRVKNLPLAEASIRDLRVRGHNAALMVTTTATAQEIRWMLNAADCLLVTSFHEGSPNIVKEAMACNLPVVSVPCGDVAERLAHVRPGGLAPYDAQHLAATMAETLDAGYRSNGRLHLWRQGLGTEVITEALGKIYLRVASTGTTPKLAKPVRMP